MGQTNTAPDQGLIAYKVERVLDETNTDTKILVLARQDGRSDSFPIWIGAAEGHAIKLALDTTLTPRPMSHDLIKSFAEHLNVSVRRVVIGDVKNSTYYATVYLENNGVERTVDARPSDAISLALRTHAPLFVTEDVLARRNTANLDSWLAKQDSKNNSTSQQEVRES
jgi:bifunctional DNase/RNase